MLKENKKTKLELKIERQKKLLSEADRLKSEIKQLTAKQEKVEKEAERRKKNRIKLHAGGMCEMTGLLNYVYSDQSTRDNEQDDLIANLIVGALLQTVNNLESSTEEQLIKLWCDGEAFRETCVSDRKMCKLNINLPKMIESVKSKISNN